MIDRRKRGGHKPTTRMARLTARLLGRNAQPWWKPHMITSQDGSTFARRNQAGMELRTSHSRAKRDPNLHARRRRLNARKQQVTLRSSTCIENGHSTLHTGGARR